MDRSMYTVLITHFYDFMQKFYIYRLKLYNVHQSFPSFDKKIIKQQSFTKLVDEIGCYYEKITPHR